MVQRLVKLNDQPIKKVKRDHYKIYKVKKSVPKIGVEMFILTCYFVKTCKWL